jgi:outer membrane lipoprotein-sorting protein
MTKVLSAIAILASALFGPAEVAQDRAEDILARAARAYESVTTLRSEFVQKIFIPALEREEEGRGVVYQKKPNYFLWKFEEPEGDVVVADGEWLWMYYTAQPEQVIRTAIRQTSENASLGSEFVVNPTERYVATYVGRENVGDRTTHMLSLVPKFDAPYTLVRVWIDASDYLVRKTEIHEEHTENVRTVTFTNLAVGVDLPDELFSFTVPEGAEVFTR